MAMIFFQCGGASFIAAAEVAATFSAHKSIEGGARDLPSGPISVIAEGELGDSIDYDIEKKIAQMLLVDDVFNESFARTVLLSDRSSHTTASSPASPRHQVAVSTSTPLKSGPYFANGNSLHKVSRIFDDAQGAFVSGLVPDGKQFDSFVEFKPGGIPIPSRLYFDPPSSQYPLLGKRVAVKDILDVQGVPTGMSSRDYRNFTGKATASAALVSQLISAGAIIVAKAKTTQFASGELACDWVDYQCPFNPRGDGYMTPDCSSTGSAVAVAAYKWLDYAIGTDTLGSITGPAAFNGVFGLRPSYGISDMNGALPVASLLDTAGFFSRSIDSFLSIAKVFYPSETSLKPLNKILYATGEFQKYSEAKQRVMISFIQDLEQTVNTSRTSFNVASAWESSTVPDTNGKFQDFLATTLAHIQLYGSYHNNKDFRDKFKAQHGREPYANPMVRYKWHLGKNITTEQFEKACKERLVWRDFLRKDVFDEGTILVLPAGSPEMFYREISDGSVEERGIKLQGFGFFRDLYSFLGGLPHFIVPVGQVLTKSPVTGGMVYEPVCVSVIGAPDTDLKLVELVSKVIEKSGRPLEVKVGSTAFEILDEK